MSTSQTTAHVALVTGAGRRIGRAIACALGDAGFAVAVHANRSAAEAEAVCAEIRARGSPATLVRAELANLDQVRGLVPAAAAALGPLTLLVNSAAQFEPDSIRALEPARWQRQLDVNLRAPIFLAEAFAAQVPDGADASIVNILDQRVLNPTPHFLSYTLAKSALHTATRTLAQALAPRIRVNAVAPGPTVANQRQSAEDFARQAGAVPLGHGPSLEELAAAVLFLASSPSITGQTLAVDGGQHLAWETPDVSGVRE